MTEPQETEPSLLVVGGGPRRRGRPRASEPGASVMTWLAESEQDAVIRIAHKHGVSMSAVVRTGVQLLLRTRFDRYAK